MGQMEVFDLIIIGGGPGGYSCAVRASQLGKSVFLIEKERVGGVCLNRGCIPTKCAIDTLKEMAFTSPEGKGLSREFLWECVKKKMESAVKTGVSHLEKILNHYKIKMAKGRASFISEKEILLNEKVFSFKNCVIATGSLPSHPEHFSCEGTFTEENWMKMDRIPEKVLIVGGGVAGCEIAYIFRKMNCEVTLVEMLDSLLPFLDRDMSKEAEWEMRKMKIDVRKNYKVEGVEKSGESIKVLGKDGEIVTGAVIFAMGRKSSSGDLNLDNAGVMHDSSGFIFVDEQLRTTKENIFAIGDVTGPPFLAHRAYEDGFTAAENICGFQRKRVKNFPYSVFCEPEIAGWGLLEREINSQDFEVIRMPVRMTGRAQASGKIGGFLKIIYEKKEKLIRGMHLISHSASEIISSISPSLRKGMTLDEIAETPFIHPTFSEVIKEACLLATGRPHHFLRS